MDYEPKTHKVHRLMFIVHRILCLTGERIGGRLKTVHARKELSGIWSQQPWVISRPRSKAFRLSATWVLGKLSLMVSSNFFRFKGRRFVPASAPPMLMLVKMGEPKERAISVASMNQAFRVNS